RDPDNGIISIEGLDPDSDYTIGYSLTTRPEGIPESQIVKIHTEAAAQIPNSDFSQKESLKVDDLLVGGEWVCGAITYKSMSSIDREIPSDWASLNALTCNKNAKSKNTWFIVPSTFVENGRAIIRSVAYSLTSSNPDKTGSFWSTTHYNTNSPVFADTEKVSGELFLGSYTYSDNANRSEGKIFASRPSSVSFDYTYTPANGSSDEGTVSIEVLDASGKVIASANGSLSAKTNITERELPLTYSQFGIKAASFRLKFKSSKQSVAPIYIPKGDELSEGSFSLPTSPYVHNIDPNKFNAVATGSVLTIDNVKLNY
ncbi:MAG: hypothetical protein K2H76_09905, partial [Muribaculaceae bacterium]|nr:hypothetical protein [Muribaculaceae bacterium]